MLPIWEKGSVRWLYAISPKPNGTVNRLDKKLTGR